MAEFNERLVFNLEVDAGNFQRELRNAITAATQNLAIRLQVRANDVKFIGRVDASKLLDTSKVAEALRLAVQQGIGRISLPTRTIGGGGGGGGGIGGPRGIDPTQPRPQPALANETRQRIQQQQQLSRAEQQAIQQRQIREAAAFQAAIGQAQRETRERVRLAEQRARAIGAIADQQRIKEAAAAQAAIGEARRLNRVREEAARRAAEAQRAATRRIVKPEVGRQAIRDQVARIRFIPEDSSVNQAIRSVSVRARRLLRRFTVSLPVNLRLAGADALRRALNVSTIRVAAASFAALGRAGGLAFTAIRRSATAGASALTAFGRGVVNIGRGIRSFAGSIRRAISPLTRFVGLIGRSAAVLTGSGLIIGGAAFLPVAAIRGATEAFRQLAEFTDGVSQSITLFSRDLSNLQGARRVEFINEKFRDLGATVQDVSARFGLTTKDVSQGLFSILSAQVGIDSATERLEALEASAQVAVGGVTDLDSAFKGVIAISRTFGTSFKQAADQLFAIQRLGIAPINRLSTQLGRVATLAKSAGASSEDLGAAIATITAQAVPLETTITGLRGFFGELAKGGSRQTRNLLAELNKIKGFENLRIDIGTLRQPGGLPKFLEQLQRLREQRPGQLERLFPQKRTIAALLPLLDSLNRFGKDREQIQKANNEAAAAADARLNTLAGGFNRLQVAVRNTIVTVADQVAALIGLGDRVKGVVATLGSFVRTLRSISSIDLRNFLKDLFTTPAGVLSLIEKLNRAFFGLIDSALQVAPGILKVFVGLAEGIRGVLSVAFKGAVAFAGKEFALLFTSISKGLAKTLPEGGLLDLSTVSPLEKARINAITALIKGLEVSVDSLTDASRGFSGNVGKIEEAVKQAFKSADEFDVGPFAKRLQGFFGRLQKDISKNILGTELTLEKRIAGLVSSINATKIRDQVRTLEEEVQREISGLKPAAPGKGFGKQLTEDILDFRAPEVARSLIGNLKALGKSGNEQIALLQQEASRRVRELNATLRKVGSTGRLGVPTRQRVGQAGVLAKEIQSAQKRIRELRQSLRQLNQQEAKLRIDGGDVEDVVKQAEMAQRLRTGKLIVEADIRDAEDNLRSLVAKSQTVFKGLAFPKGLFSALGAEELFRGDIIGQFRAVSQEVDRLNKRLAAGGKVDTGLLARLQQLQSSIAIRLVRFEPLVQVDPTARAKVEEGFSTLLKRSRENVESIASRTFADIPIFGRINFPSFEPISDTDRQKLQQRTTQLATQLKGFAISSASQLGKDSPIARAFADLEKRVRSFIDVINDIGPALRKQTEGPVGNFDQITFSVLDAESAVKRFVDALDRSVVDRARSLEQALDRALAQPFERAASRAANVPESDPSFIGPRSIDSSVNTFNIQPDDLIFTERALNQGTESQQNTAKKGMK